MVRSVPVIEILPRACASVPRFTTLMTPEELVSVRSKGVPSIEERVPLKAIPTSACKVVAPLMVIGLAKLIDPLVAITPFIVRAEPVKDKVPKGAALLPKA